MEMPFTEMPSGLGIARYFIEECASKPQGAEGYDIYREGGDYCYIWKLLECDLDYEGSWLLEVRTSLNGTETRDFLKVIQKGGKVYCEWRNKPVEVFCSRNEWNGHMVDGIQWFTATTVANFFDDYED